MKTLGKKLAALLAAAMAISSFAAFSVTALAKDAEDYHLLTSTFNTKTVYNGPTEEASFNIDKDTMLQAVTTYHWNNGNGKTPGSIALLENGVKVGEWQATGRSGSGRSNVLWDVFPDYVLKGGNHYTIVDSDNDTWSYNSDSYNIGFVELRGYGIGSQYDPSANGSQSSSSGTSTGTSGGLKASDWAKQEVEQAISYGIVPSNLRTSDLTQPINRRDFAVISLNAYEKMSGDTVAAGSNPFYDTSDSDVVKAYTAGIIAGTSDTTFSPNDALTREQAAAMLTRAYKKTIYSNWTLAGDDGFPLIYKSAGAFDDGYSISDWAYSSVDFMASKGIVSGMGDGTFAPKSTVTREQAIAIAVRMIKNLDTTPQENTGAQQQTGGSSVKEGESVPASGTVDYDDVHITFGSGNGGEVVMAKDGEETVVGLTEEPSAPVTIAIDAEAPGSDEEYALEVGIPYSDGDSTGMFTAYYDAEYSDGKAVASVDISAFEDIMNSTSYDTANSAGYKLNAPLAAKKIPGTKAYARTFTVKKLKTIFKLSDGGNFKVRIPAKFTSKVTEKDAKNIGNDLEEIRKNYENKGFKIYYTGTMNVYGNDLGSEEGGSYIAGLGYMNINLAKLTKGYDSSYSGGAGELYATLAHEYFHCVERGYAWKAFECRWFDEACAAYYETVLTAEKGLGNGGNPYEAASTDMHQFKGVVPQYVSLASVFWDGERGYGRKPVIEYLQKTAGDSFIRKVYEEGGTWTQSGVSDYIVKHSGKSLAEIAQGFYTELLTTNNLDAKYQDPWDIYNAVYYDTSMNEVASKITLNGRENSSIGYTISPYGAHLMTLDLGAVPSQYGYINIEMKNAGHSCIVVAMNNKKDEYKYYYSTNAAILNSTHEGINRIPLTAQKYLIIAINQTDSSYSGGLLGSEAQLAVTFSDAYDKISTWASDETEILNIPSSYSGDITYTEKTKTQEMVTSTDASISLSVQTNGKASVRVSSSDGKYSYLNDDLTYSPATGMCTGNGVSVQLEPVGFYGETSIFQSLNGTHVRVHIYEGDKLTAVATGHDGGGVKIGNAPEDHSDDGIMVSP